MKRKQIDWERAEKDYRAGQLSTVEISRQIGVTETAVRKRAKRDGWVRDLAGAVKKATREKLVRSTVRSSDACDQQVIEEAAARGVEVVRSHRNDISAGRGICAMLLTELRDGTENPQLVSELVDQTADAEEWDAKRRSAAQRAISLPSRAGVMRDLATAMKTLQGLERVAFNLDERQSETDPLDALLQAVSDTSRGIEGYDAD